MNIAQYHSIIDSLPPHVRLVAVSKNSPVSDISQLYKEGHRIFGENKVQELQKKHELLPQDIEWHFIGHLQRNKVKYIAPFVKMIHAVDSLPLLIEIDKQAKKNNRTIACLLQFHIAQEDTKFGLSLEEAEKLLNDEAYNTLKNIELQGVMGMATFTSDINQVKIEFQKLHSIFISLQEHFFKNCNTFREISMGMTDDYSIAIEEGSTLVRIGSAIFSSR